MRYQQLWPICLALLLAGISSGCGLRNPLNRQPLSGTVKLDGEPLETGIIAFHSLQEDGVSNGTSLTNGKYGMTAARGLPPGTYRVTISAQEVVASPNDPPPEELIPAEYNVNSDKTVTVSADVPNEFNFDIKTK